MEVCEHITVSESHDQVLPGCDALASPNNFGTPDRHTDIITQKCYEKKKMDLIDDLKCEY